MNVSELSADDRKLADQTIGHLIDAYDLDYQGASSLLRTLARNELRRRGTVTTDKREQTFTIKKMTIWDIRNGMDNAIEDSSSDETFTVQSLKGVATAIAEMLEGYHEYMGWPVPESCTLATMHARIPSLKTQLHRNDGDSHIRVYFQDPEGSQYIAITEVERGEVS